MKPREWEVWDEERAKHYIRSFGTPQNPTPQHRERMKLASSLLEGETVLDVGCGLGHLYPWIRDKVRDYLGIDNSIHMINLARKFQPSAKFQYGDIYDLRPFGKFDTVYCQSLLIHLPDSEKPIKEMWKHALKSLVFSVPISSVPTSKRQKYKDGYLILRWEIWESIFRVIKELKGVQEVYRYPHPMRCPRSPTSGFAYLIRLFTKVRTMKSAGLPVMRARNEYIKVTRMHETP